MTRGLEFPTQFVSVERGEIDRRIFSDPEIFELEMELIFGRAWLFIGHESQIPKVGDFFEAPMGKDHVLVVRQRDASVKALLNTCTHRGNAVCRAEEGSTKNFMCTYHGWTFAISGELVGVPGSENLYHGELDKASLGLRETAQLDIYKGFIFATMDPLAPSLYDYLGATGRLGIDLIAARGDMEIIPGVQKYVIDCNWKFAVDNLFDWYHPAITHMSAFSTGLFPRNEEVQDSSVVIDRGGALKEDGSDLDVPAVSVSDVGSMVIIGEYGHAIGGPTLEAMRSMVEANPAVMKWRQRPEAAAVLGPVGSNTFGHPNIFPNSWVTNGAQLCLRVPRSASSTEFWYFSFVDRNATEEERTMSLMFANHVFGPAGLLEQEDGENWSQSTRQTHGYKSREIPQALKMNLGKGKIIKEHGLSRIESAVSEHAQLWTYLSWAQYMSGANWDVIRQNTVPGEFL